MTAIGPSPSDAIGGDAAPNAHGVGPAELDALAAEVAAGRLTAREAVCVVVDRMVEASELEIAEQAELRELLTDLVTNDPHLAALVERI
jgi:hypothetical protein